MRGEFSAVRVEMADLAGRMGVQEISRMPCRRHRRGRRYHRPVSGATCQRRSGLFDSSITEG
jgi:hypothetical protein